MTTKNKKTKQTAVPSLLIWNFPKELRRMFKIHCAELGKPMNHRLIELVTKDCQCQKDVKPTI